MVELLQPPQKPPNRSNLILHCGAHSKSRNVVKRVPTPKGTATWTPIPHILLIEEVERALKTNGLTIANQAHSLTHDQSRYFGLMEVRNGKSHEDYAYVLGLRNSHDKRFPAGIVAGRRRSRFRACPPVLQPRSRHASATETSQVHSPGLPSRPDRPGRAAVSRPGRANAGCRKSRPPGPPHTALHAPG